MTARLALFQAMLTHVASPPSPAAKNRSEEEFPTAHTRLLTAQPSSSGLEASVLLRELCGREHSWGQAQDSEKALHPLKGTINAVQF